MNTFFDLDIKFSYWKIGNQNNCISIVLSHFSQRYSRFAQCALRVFLTYVCRDIYKSTLTKHL